MPIDYTEYPPDWPVIRLRILERAGLILRDDFSVFREAHCEWCGAENHRPHPETGSMVVLTIAHLDHDKENWNVKDDRLAALCQRCHLRHDAKHHASKRKYGNERGQLMLIEDRRGKEARLA